MKEANKLSDFVLPEIEAVPSLRQRVYSALEEMIVLRRLEPGTHLIEDELARKLRVSRNPVREALQRLVHDGLADYVPARGVFVHTPTPEEVRDVLQIRAVLETEAARLAACNQEQKDIDRLTHIIHRGREAVAEQSIQELIDSNSSFHRAVIVATGNAVLDRSMEMLRKPVDWYFSSVVVARSDSSWDEHEGIASAINDRNEELAAKLMRDHVDRTRVFIEAQLEADPLFNKTRPE